MRIKCYLPLLALCSICISTTAVSAMKKKTKPHFKLIESYTQKVKQQGEPDSPPMTGTHFIIKWDNAQYPEAFFWRAQSGWLSCKIEKAHKNTGRSKSTPKGIPYTTEDVSGDDIHRGDTLKLSPVTGGRFPIPAEIPASAKNTLFYKTGGSGWLAFPVKKIAKKADVVITQ